MTEPLPPRLNSDEYAKWIIANVSQIKNLSNAALQKKIEEPPLKVAFHFPGNSSITSVAEPSDPWPEK